MEGRSPESPSSSATPRPPRSSPRIGRPTLPSRRSTWPPPPPRPTTSRPPPTSKLALSGPCRPLRRRPRALDRNAGHPEGHAGGRPALASTSSLPGWPWPPWRWPGAAVLASRADLLRPAPHEADRRTVIFPFGRPCRVGPISSTPRPRPSSSQSREETLGRECTRGSSIAAAKACAADRFRRPVLLRPGRDRFCGGGLGWRATFPVARSAAPGGPSGRPVVHHLLPALSLASALALVVWRSG